MVYIDILETTFLVWFGILFFAPSFVLFVLTSIGKKNPALDGLVVTPLFDPQENLLTIDTNFNDFYNNITLPYKRSNIIIKILKAMCDDAKGGKKCPPEAYTGILKNVYKSFTLAMFMLCFVPSAVTLFFYSAYNYKYFDIYSLLIFQLLCLSLVFILRAFLQYKYERFSNLVLREWYGKILDFDSISINAIKPRMLDELKTGENVGSSHIIAKFEGMNALLAEGLAQSSEALAKKIDILSGLYKADKLVTPENTIDSLQANVEKTAALSDVYDEIAVKVNAALTALDEIVNTPQLNINDFNKNATLLLELKTLFASYQSKSNQTELEQLKNITTTLNNKIGETFLSVESSVAKTSKNLEDSYERFFEMCKQFNESFSGTVDSKQVADSLRVLLEKSQYLETQIAALKKARPTKSPKKKSTDDSEIVEQPSKENVPNDNGDTYFLSYNYKNTGPYKLNNLIAKIKSGEITQNYFASKNSGPWKAIMWFEELPADLWEKQWPQF